MDRRLSELHPDHASLRRYLAGEHFVDRDHDVSWRSGGHVRPDD